MPRNAAWYLNYLVNEIHRTVVSTLDDDGLPVTAAIDMMMADESGLYFLTARGKNFYDRLGGSSWHSRVRRATAP